MIYLQQFTFQFEYRPGRSHGNADAVSRRPAAGSVVTVVHRLEMNPDDVSRAQLADEHLAPVIKALKEEKPLPTNSAPGLRKAFI